MNFLYQADLFLFKLANQATSNFIFDWFFPAITDLHLNKWFSIPIILIIFSCLIYKFKKKGLLYFLFLILTVSTSDFSGGKIKHIVNRPRPFQNIETMAIQRSPASMNTSFYSNHASNNSAFATYMSFVFPEAKFVFITIATLVTYSRVYNGVHYPSDIFIGSFMGIFWGFLFHFLLIKLFSMNRKRIT